MRLAYTKMSGAGNTFIMLDGRELPADLDLAALSRRICDVGLEHNGADGMIAIKPWPGGDFEMRYYNRDGSTGMMCGNGGRCAVRHAVDLGLTRDPGRVDFINAGVRYLGAITERGVKIVFPDPREFRLGLAMELFGGPRLCHFADVGTPHAVVFVDEAIGSGIDSVDRVDIARWGPELRGSAQFGTEGANANFVEVVPGQSAIRLRTFERGVEAETGACGTGAIASAIIAALLRGLTPPVEVTTTSGESLWVDFGVAGDRLTDVSLEGGADVMARGAVEVGEGTGREVRGEE